MRNYIKGLHICLYCFGGLQRLLKLFGFAGMTEHNRLKNMNYFVERNLGFVLVLIMPVSESHRGQQTLTPFQQ